MGAGAVGSGKFAWKNPEDGAAGVLCSSSTGTCAGSALLSSHCRVERTSVEAFCCFCVALKTGAGDGALATTGTAIVGSSIGAGVGSGFSACNRG